MTPAGGSYGGSLATFGTEAGGLYQGASLPPVLPPGGDGPPKGRGHLPYQGLGEEKLLHASFPSEADTLAYVDALKHSNFSQWRSLEEVAKGARGGSCSGVVNTSVLTALYLLGLFNLCAASPTSCCVPLPPSSSRRRRRRNSNAAANFGGRRLLGSPLLDGLQYNLSSLSLHDLPHVTTPDGGRIPIHISVVEEVRKLWDSNPRLLSNIPCGSATASVRSSFISLSGVASGIILAYSIAQLGECYPNHREPQGDQNHKVWLFPVPKPNPPPSLYMVRSLPTEIPVTGEDEPSDGCARQAVRMEDGHCARLLSSDQCPFMHWVLINKDTGKGECVPRVCPEGKIFVEADQMCHAVDEPDFCPDGQRLFLTAWGEAVCDCLDGMYHGADGQCHRLYEPAYCDEGTVLQFHKMTKTLTCKVDPCHEKNRVRKPTELPYARSPRNGICYRLSSTGPCNEAQKFGYDIERLTPSCISLQEAGLLRPQRSFQYSHMSFPTGGDKKFPHYEVSYVILNGSTWELMMRSVGRQKRDAALHLNRSADETVVKFIDTTEFPRTMEEIMPGLKEFGLIEDTEEEVATQHPEEKKEIQERKSKVKNSQKRKRRRRKKNGKKSSRRRSKNRRRKRKKKRKSHKQKKRKENIENSLDDHEKLKDPFITIAKKKPDKAAKEQQNTVGQRSDAKQNQTGNSSETIQSSAQNSTRDTNYYVEKNINAEPLSIIQPAEEDSLIDPFIGSHSEDFPWLRFQNGTQIMQIHNENITHDNKNMKAASPPSQNNSNELNLLLNQTEPNVANFTSLKQQNVSDCFKTNTAMNKPILSFNSANGESINSVKDDTVNEKEMSLMEKSNLTKVNNTKDTQIQLPKEDKHNTTRKALPEITAELKLNDTLSSTNASSSNKDIFKPESRWEILPYKNESTTQFPEWAHSSNQSLEWPENKTALSPQKGEEHHIKNKTKLGIIANASTALLPEMETNEDVTKASAANVATDRIPISKQAADLSPTIKGPRRKGTINLLQIILEKSKISKELNSSSEERDIHTVKGVTKIIQKNFEAIPKNEGRLENTNTTSSSGKKARRKTRRRRKRIKGRRKSKGGANQLSEKVQNEDLENKNQISGLINKTKKGEVPTQLEEPLTNLNLDLLDDVSLPFYLRNRGRRQAKRNKAIPGIINAPLLNQCRPGAKRDYNGHCRPKVIPESIFAIIRFQSRRTYLPTYPRIKCGQGTRLDSRGVCRQTFSGLG